PNDQAALIAFADSIAQETLDPTRESGFTTDKAALIALINNLEADGGTPLYDALYKAVRLANEANLGQRSIILLTDGRDEGVNPTQPGSQWASQETPIQEAKDADTPIFTIGLGTQTDAGYLERVARTTGGIYQQAPDSTALAETFQNVIERLKQQYLVTYRSGFDCDGQEHRVEVGVKVNGRSASDSALFTMPLNPGCNISAIITATPTSTPTASATPTIEPTKTSTPTATATTAVVPTITPQPPDDQSGIPVWLIGGLGVVLVGGGGLFLFARRRNPEQYCQTCGYRLGANDASCPKCGSAQTFVDGKQ
ncbi:MAG: VWA domain-containing protein, partial [Chloroflexi bacterium]|nr:VWA domain-containing protein [Chloroflexota bacterium]